MINKYRKKPVVIEAVQWTGDNLEEVMNFLQQRSAFKHNNSGVEIRTLEGSLYASSGDYVIKGIQGEFYPCKPSIFEATYEKVEEENSAAKPLPELDYNTLNPGIGNLVKLLRDNGFDTRDSGDGVTQNFQCDIGIPYVHMVTTRDALTFEADRLMQVLTEAGVTLEPTNEEGTTATIEAGYNPLGRWATLTVFNVLDKDLRI